MTARINRVMSMLAGVTIGGLALAGCAADADVSGDGPTEESVAVLEEFFDHLEAGESAEAAALTDVDFPSEFIDHDFYAASAAKPTDAQIVETSGADSHSVTATVEYVLDDPDNPVATTYTVKNTDGDRSVSWSSAGQYSLIMVSSPGRIMMNGTLEFPMNDGGQDLVLLPGLYDVSYVDPTGTTHLDGDGANEFTLPHPVVDDTAAAAFPENVSVTGSAVSITAFVGSSVTDAVEEEVADLTAQCVEEKMVGPSCPPEIREYGSTFADPSTAEWFEDPNLTGVTVTDGAVQYSMGFSVVVDGNRLPMQAVYEGTVTQSDDGVVEYTMTN